MNSTVCAECGNDSGANDFCDSCLLWRDAAFFERARVIARLREKARQLDISQAMVPDSIGHDDSDEPQATLRRMADLLESEAS